MVKPAVATRFFFVRQGKNPSHIPSARRNDGRAPMTEAVIANEFRLKDISTLSSTF